MYADVILDWLQHNHPAIFPASFVAERMQLNLEKVVRGLKILEIEFKVVLALADGPITRWQA
jgi:hypothetical protein